MKTIRREQILELIRAKKAVSLKELSQMFSGVSTMTIHRDLQELESRGLIERVRGGARALPPRETLREPAFAERVVTSRRQKEIVAEKARGLLRSGSAIYLDAGTTAMALAEVLTDFPLSVVTNSPNIAIALASRSLVNVTLCGGMLNKRDLALYGSMAVSGLEKINIDLAFVAASGFSADGGFTCGNDGEAALKRLVCRKARSVALLMDSGKLDHALPYTFARPADIDFLVCDKALPPSLQALFSEKGVQVL